MCRYQYHYYSQCGHQEVLLYSICDFASFANTTFAPEEPRWESTVNRDNDIIHGSDERGVHGDDTCTSTHPHLDHEACRPVSQPLLNTAIGSIHPSASLNHWDRHHSSTNHTPITYRQGDCSLSSSPVTPQPKLTYAKALATDASHLPHEPKSIGKPPGAVKMRPQSRTPQSQTMPRGRKQPNSVLSISGRKKLPAEKQSTDLRGGQISAIRSAPHVTEMDYHGGETYDSIEDLEAELDFLREEVRQLHINRPQQRSSRMPLSSPTPVHYLYRSPGHYERIETPAMRLQRLHERNGQTRIENERRSEFSNYSNNGEHERSSLFPSLLSSIHGHEFVGREGRMFESTQDTAARKSSYARCVIDNAFDELPPEPAWDVPPVSDSTPASFHSWYDRQHEDSMHDREDDIHVRPLEHDSEKNQRPLPKSLRECTLVDSQMPPDKLERSKLIGQQTLRTKKLTGLVLKPSAPAKRTLTSKPVLATELRAANRNKRQTLPDHWTAGSNADTADDRADRGKLPLQNSGTTRKSRLNGSLKSPCSKASTPASKVASYAAPTSASKQKATKSYENSASPRTTSPSKSLRTKEAASRTHRDRHLEARKPAVWTPQDSSANPSVLGQSLLHQERTSNMASAIDVDQCTVDRSTPDPVDSDFAVMLQHHSENNSSSAKMSPLDRDIEPRYGAENSLQAHEELERQAVKAHATLLEAIEDIDLGINPVISPKPKSSSSLRGGKRHPSGSSLILSSARDDEIEVQSSQDPECNAFQDIQMVNSTAPTSQETHADVNLSAKVANSQEPLLDNDAPQSCGNSVTVSMAAKTGHELQASLPLVTKEDEHQSLTDLTTKEQSHTLSHGEEEHAEAGSSPTQVSSGNHKEWEPTDARTTFGLRADAPSFVPTVRSSFKHWVPDSEWLSLSAEDRESVRIQRRAFGSSTCSPSFTTGGSRYSDLSSPTRSSDVEVDPQGNVVSPRKRWMFRGVTGSPSNLGRAPLPTSMQDYILSEPVSSSPDPQGWAMSSAHPRWMYGWRGGDGREIAFSGYGPDAERVPNPSVKYRPYNTMVRKTKTAPAGPRSLQDSTFDNSDMSNIPQASRDTRETQGMVSAMQCPVVPCNNIEIMDAVEHVAINHPRMGLCHECTSDMPLLDNDKCRD